MIFPELFSSYNLFNDMSIHYIPCQKTIFHDKSAICSLLTLKLLAVAKDSL
jgi:hypothetical protein